jgi:hypothetical protein
MFDTAVGALEDYIMGLSSLCAVHHLIRACAEPSFSEMQTKFFNQHCDKFEDSEENKLEHTPIFEAYV